jgi:hypothetical protein
MATLDGSLLISDSAMALHQRRVFLDQTLSLGARANPPIIDLSHDTAPPVRIADSNYGSLAGFHWWLPEKCFRPELDRGSGRLPRTRATEQPRHDPDVSCRKASAAHIRESCG